MGAWIVLSLRDGDGPGFCLGDGQTEAPGGPAERGRSYVLWRMLPFYVRYLSLQLGKEQQRLQAMTAHLQAKQGEPKPSVHPVSSTLSIYDLVLHYYMCSVVVPFMCCPETL